MARVSNVRRHLLQINRDKSACILREEIMRGSQHGKRTPALGWGSPQLAGVLKHGVISG